MPVQLVGHVKSIFRYPIKSMQGESLTSANVTQLGLEGDRSYALRLANGKIASAKRTTALLSYDAYFTDTENSNSIMIRLPSGESIAVDDPMVNQRLSEAVETDVILEKRHPNQRNFGELDANTIFGETPIQEALEGKKRQLPSDATEYDLASGTYFDSAHLHLLTTGTLKHLDRLLDGQSNTDVHRFRPNILIETTPDLEGFIEDDWVNAQLLVGDTVVIGEIWPTLRCVMTTLPQKNLPHDSRILRTIVKQHENHLGVFAGTETTGTIKLGDTVRLLK